MVRLPTASVMMAGSLSLIITDSRHSDWDSVAVLSIMMVRLGMGTFDVLANVLMVIRLLGSTGDSEQALGALINR